MATLRSDFPEIRVPLVMCAQILNGSVVHAFTKPRPLNGRRRPAPKKVNGAALRVEERRERRPEPMVRSAWDPPSPQSGSCCKALLLEVLRRAAHDWVLYRSHSKLSNRECAEDAYTWLFEEDAEHPAGRHRATAVFDLDGGDQAVGARSITAFLGICEALDLDPETVRARVRQMDIQTIISAGRPAETRRTKRGEAAVMEECNVAIGVNVDAMPRDQQYETQYESYGTVVTPDMLSLNDVPGIY